VHGSWAGSVVWRELAPRLRKAGHDVYAPTLTGIGARKHLLNREIDLNTHVQDVIGLIEDADLSDIVLVANSYGGMVITGVADRVPENLPRSSISMPFCRRTGNPVLAYCRPVSLLPPSQARTGWYRRYPRLCSASNVPR
jgi:pimeloyl-ACP methyl ester carboxylesterase